jgi:hypothetical protein
MVRVWLRYTGSISRRNPSRNPMIQILLRLVKYALYGLQIFQAVFGFLVPVEAMSTPTENIVL